MSKILISLLVALVSNLSFASSLYKDGQKIDPYKVFYNASEKVLTVTQLPGGCNFSEASIRDAGFDVISFARLLKETSSVIRVSSDCKIETVDFSK